MMSVLEDCGHSIRFKGESLQAELYRQRNENIIPSRSRRLKPKTRRLFFRGFIRAKENCVRLKNSGSYMTFLEWKSLSLMSRHLNHSSLGLCSGVLSINVGSPNAPFSFGSLIILWKYANASGY